MKMEAGPNSEIWCLIKNYTRDKVQKKVDYADKQKCVKDVQDVPVSG